ncbi:MAG: transcriptional regulator, HxlR family [Anaerocolumna sp.]|nr:transcriptional regulator, HxlR family [Anaerocolumna sp.]
MNNNMDCNEGFPSDNVYETKCPLIYALEIIGQKWKLPIMKSLKELEEHNLIIRIQYETIPPKVEYSLTERGKQLLPALNELSKWGEEQLKLDKPKLNVHAKVSL